jgi:hypothetical protein
MLNKKKQAIEAATITGLTYAPPDDGRAAAVWEQLVAEMREQLALAGELNARLERELAARQLELGAARHLAQAAQDRAAAARVEALRAGVARELRT